MQNACIKFALFYFHGNMLGEVGNEVTVLNEHISEKFLQKKNYKLQTTLTELQAEMVVSPRLTIWHVNTRGGGACF